jgi:hypothetical protein
MTQVKIELLQNELAVVPKVIAYANDIIRKYPI